MPVLILAILAYFYSRENHDWAMEAGSKVGVVHLLGVIIDAEPIIEQIEELIQEQGIQALVVRIDSPGGAVGATQEIYEKLREVREIMPVYASIQNVGASGGYYAALGASKIYANGGSMTGSIGVIIQGYNFQELMEKIGVSDSTHKAGRNKDILSPFRASTEEENQILATLMKDIHDQFKTAVLDNRPEIHESDLDTLADGRIFSGKQAREHKLIDDLLSFDQITEIIMDDLAVESLNIVYPEMDPESYLKNLFESKLNAFGLGTRRFLGPRPMFLAE